MRNRLLVLLGVLATLGLLSKVLQTWVADSLGLEAADLVDSPPPQREVHQLVEPQLGFQISFPARPQRETLDGGARLYKIETAAEAFVVTAHPVPPGPKPIIDMVASGLNAQVAQQPGTRVVQLMPCLEVPGTRGFDVLFESSQSGAVTRYWMRLLLASTRYYSVSALTRDASAASRFIDSFSLLPGALAAAGQGRVSGS